MAYYVKIDFHTSMDILADARLRIWIDGQIYVDIKIQLYLVPHRHTYSPTYVQRSILKDRHTDIRQDKYTDNVRKDRYSASSIIQTV